VKLTLATSLAALAVLGCSAPPPQEAEPGATGPQARMEQVVSSSSGMVGGVHPRQIIALFGARLRDGVTDRELVGYRRVFGFGDRDGDGRHSMKEYVDEGVYMTRQARQGIFNAADSDDDGFVTRDEYVENRIITDEAKRIFERMDADRNGRLTSEELVGSGILKDENLSAAVFHALDANGNGELILPEYLRTWGRWARN